jgi:hypothetical protein
MGELETLRREGESIPLTVGAAMQQLSNTAMALVGSFDQVTGGSGALANLLVNLYPVLVQRYTRARIEKITSRRP